MAKEDYSAAGLTVKAAIQTAVDNDMTELFAHVAATEAHGATGAVAGTTNNQTFTNKEIDADTNTITNIANANIKVGAGIDATKLADGSVSNTEFQYLNGVTSLVQTQLNTKQATITGAATTIDDTDLTASRAVISDGSGKVSVSDVTTTELNYLDGVTSAIQTQINATVKKTGNETIAGTKTFSSFPVTPSSAPIADYQVANKAYSDTKIKSVNVVKYTSSSTYSKPSNLVAVEVHLCGGGGGGGGVDGQGSGTWGSGRSGGGGGYSMKTILAGDLGASETITVGAGGAGGSAGANTGANGGQTSFGSHFHANGGYGGPGVTASASKIVRLGGLGADGSGTYAGDVNVNGGMAGHSIMLGSGIEWSVSGVGGASAFSGGSEAVSDDSAGNNGSGYGGGGSGASVAGVNTNYAGGNGSSGIVVIKEFLK